MENKNPYHSLIDNCLGLLSLKFNTSFKYEIEKNGEDFFFTIYKKDEAIYTKKIPLSEANNEYVDFIHYQIVRDLFNNSIQRMLMEKENSKKLFPKKHSKIETENINLTKGSW